MGGLSKWKHLLVPVLGIAAIGFVAFGFGHTEKKAAAASERLRLAYFPNVTHAAGVVGVAQGRFQRQVGKDTNVEPVVFNAGPEEMEALLAGEVDLGYVGPSPAINTYVKSNGRALRILAGACSGGAALVARPDAGISSIRDLSGKRLAVPQLGGTQDVSARHFLAANGLGPKEKGGTVEIMPIKNPDILALFLRKQLDAAWVPEPWASRLVNDAKAKVVVDERDLWPGRKFTSTVLVARTGYLEKHLKQVDAVLRAHLHAVQWLQHHPDEGQTVVNAELKRLTGKELPAGVMKESWSHVAFTEDPNRPNIEAFVQAATEAGFLKPGGPEMAALFEPGALEIARRAVSPVGQ